MTSTPPSADDQDLRPLPEFTREHPMSRLASVVFGVLNLLLIAALYQHLTTGGVFDQYMRPLGLTAMFGSLAALRLMLEAGREARRERTGLYFTNQPYLIIIIAVALGLAAFGLSSGHV